MTSFYTKISSFVKCITGINDFSLFRKKIHKNIGKLFYHKKYTSKDIVSIMKKMGMKEGSIVCIHSSMKEFYNFKGTPNDLINEILSVIGSEGTLVMPAYPKKLCTDSVFNPKTDPTGAGLLAETFRKVPGVLRSNNVQHSVCAIGKYASYLLEEHTSGEDCWDTTSPWYKMCISNALVFNLGMPRSYIGTFHHCVESLLKHTHPYWEQFFTKKQKYRYLSDKNEIVEYTNLTCGITRRTREKKVTKFFNNEDWQIERISNLEIKVFYSNSCLKKMIELGRRGITVYYEPSPKKYIF